MSYGVLLSTPTQCVSQTITWSGPAGGKALGMWVQGTNYFAEIPRQNLTETLGTVEWMCDVPAGAWIAFEIYSLPSAANWSTSQFYQVQPGTTDACLRKNDGQRAVESMSALASSLSSASPQLFTYTATSTSASTTSSATSATSATTSATVTPAGSPSSSPLNVGALAGGIAGGIVGVAILAALAFLLIRRHSRGKSSASPSSKEDTEKTASPPAAPGGFFRAVSTNPVDTWRARVHSGAPPSRQSRAISGATNPALLGAPLLPPALSGPRAGVPEVGEGGDYEAYRLGGASFPPSGAYHAYGALPAASASATGLLETREPALAGPAVGAEEVVRPPTRLTTPAGLTEFGRGEGAGHAGTACASYSRGL